MAARRVTKNQDHSGPAHTAERMATAIMECLDVTDQCSIQDLRVMGFSLDELARYWPEAWKIVEARRPRRP